MLTSSTLSNQRRAHQRLVIERALIRFVVDEGLVPITALAPFLDLDETTALRSNLLHDDAVFPDEAEPHYALIATVEATLIPPTHRDELAIDEASWLKPPSLRGAHDLAVRGTDVAPDLLQVIGDRRALFEVVAEQSRDPRAVWDLARAALDGSETVH